LQHKIGEIFKDPEKLILLAKVVMSDFDTWDSMSRLSLIALLDEHFEIEISDDEFENMTTVQDLYDKVQTKVQANG
jgi:acyl carrier protein